MSNRVEEARRRADEVAAGTASAAGTDDPLIAVDFGTPYYGSTSTGRTPQTSATKMRASDVLRSVDGMFGRRDGSHVRLASNLYKIGALYSMDLARYANSVKEATSTAIGMYQASGSTLPFAQWLDQTANSIGDVPGGDGSRTGGAGRAYSGPVSQVTNLSDIDIRRVANEYSMAAVGREVTDEEFARIKSRVQRAEERNPTRTEGKGAKRRTVSGLSAETRSQIIQDVTTNLVTKGLDSTGDLQADARENAEALRAWVRSNGLEMGEQAISGYVRRILKGDTTLDDVKSDLRRTYMQGMFPAWADKINAGEDPADFLAPYVSRVQQLLEDENIDLNDSLVKKATQFVGDDGKPRMLPLYEVERLARKDPRWQYTSNALDLYSRVGDGILRTFGMR